MAKLAFKVIFPKTSPIASKTFNLEQTLTIKQVITTIDEQVKSSFSTAKCGFYIPEKNIWLDEEKTLEDYEDVIRQTVCFVFSCSNPI